jgi:serine/threonine protein kinase
MTIYNYPTWNWHPLDSFSYIYDHAEPTKDDLEIDGYFSDGAVHYAISKLPKEIHKLSSSQVTKITAFAEQQFQHQTEAPDLRYVDKKESGLTNALVLDKKNRSFFIVSEKIKDDDRKGHAKKANDAILVQLLPDGATAKHYVQLRGYSSPQELEWLKKYSGLDTHTVKRPCSRGKKYNHLDILQEAGRSLFELRENDITLSWLDMKDIFLKITTTLSQMHADDVIHNDLKTDNIIVIDPTKKSKRVAIIDYDHSYNSINKLNSNRNNAVDYGFSCLDWYSGGYACYENSAPEILLEVGRLQDIAKQEKAEDMFALGCLIHHFVYEEITPWIDDPETNLEKYHAWLEKLKLECGDIQGPIEKLIEEVMIALLNPNPAERPTAGEVCQWLLAYPNPRPQPRPPEPLETPKASFDLNKLLFTDAFLTTASHDIAKQIVSCIKPKPECQPLASTDHIAQKLVLILIQGIRKLTLERTSAFKMQFDDIDILLAGIKESSRNVDDFNLPTAVEIAIASNRTNLILTVELHHSTEYTQMFQQKIPPKPL